MAVRLAVELLPERVRVARVDTAGVADVRQVLEPRAPGEVAEALTVLAARSPEPPSSLGFAVGAWPDWPAGR